MGIAVPTRKHLWARSKNECAFPGCTAKLSQDSPPSDDTGVLVVGQEAHIRSGRLDGPRYNEAYALQGLVDTFENLLLLCPNHHVMVDANGGKGYSVEQLLDIKRGHEKEVELEERLEQIIDSYINLSYREDDQVRFEAVDLNGPSVDSLFVDVPIAAPLASDLGGHLERVAEAHPGDIEAREGAGGLAVAGAAQALLHPGWHGNALIQGGPGQGKSTLLQFLCQFYRAHHRGRNATTYTKERHDLTPVTTVSRIPFRIDLRHYAAWRRKQRRTFDGGKKRRDRDAPTPVPAATHLEHYLAFRVSDAVGREFSTEDFVKLVAYTPVLLALDGLDEVADLADRDAIGDEILAAADRLMPNASDLHMFIASRPGSTSSALWSGDTFPVLLLRPLTTGLRVQYLERWCEQVGVGPNRAAELQRKLLDHQDKAHVRDLGSNPMQLAILLHLLYRKSLLPQQRTELFDAYIETFLDREEVDKEPLLQDHRELIVHIHRRVAWELHTSVETGDSSGSIRRPDLKILIEDVVSEASEKQALAAKIYEALTSRMLCLVSRRQGQFEFEVQSLREYFAAMHVFEEAPPQGRKNSRDDCLNALLERPYWSNAARFLVGKLSKGELRALVGNLRSRSRTRDAQLDPYLRSLAVDLIDDRVFRSLGDGEMSEAIEFILGGNGVVLAEDGLLSNGSPLSFKVSNARTQALRYALQRLRTEANPTIERMLVALAVRHAPIDGFRDRLWTAVLAGPADRQKVDLLADAEGFRDLSSAQSAQLSQLLMVKELLSASTVRTTICDTLHRGGYNGGQSALLDHCRAEIGRLGSEGALDNPAGPLTGVADGRTALTFLLGAGTPTLLADGGGRPARLLVELNEGAATRRRRRTRGGESDHPVDQVRRYVEAAAALNADWLNYRRWNELIGMGRAVWGDGILMRQLLLRVPADIDLTLGSDPDIGHNANMRAQMAWLGVARANASTPSWWSLPNDADATEQVTWALALLTIARTNPVVAHLAELNTALANMPPDIVRALWFAVLLAHNSSLSTTLRLGEPLGRQRINPSGEAAAMLHISAPEDARRKLESIAALAWEDSPDHHCLPAVAFRALRLDHVGHPAMNYGVRTGSAGLKTMSIAAARSVLDAPASYSTDRVRAAAATASETRARSLKPIIETAKKDDWFEG